MEGFYLGELVGLICYQKRLAHRSKSAKQLTELNQLQEATIKTSENNFCNIAS